MGEGQYRALKNWVIEANLASVPNVVTNFSLISYFTKYLQIMVQKFDGNLPSLITRGPLQLCSFKGNELHLHHILPNLRITEDQYLWPKQNVRGKK